jgi:uncharacterized protein (UPF0303 family)
MSRILPLGGLEITDAFFAQLEAEDRELRFDRFEHADGIAVGQYMLRVASERGLSIAGALWIGGQTVFSFALPGTSADNDVWLARKAAVVRRYDASSFLAAARWSGLGAAPGAEVGVDTIAYAFAGGAVPIRIGATQVGVVGATGVNDFVEHDLVVEALRDRMSDGAGTA